MFLNKAQINRIIDTIKELVNTGIDTLVDTYINVETENPKTKSKRKHRAKKKNRSVSTTI